MQRPCLRLENAEKRAISVAIFGDGGNKPGLFAREHELPRCVVAPCPVYCENNEYGMSAAAPHDLHLPIASAQTRYHQHDSVDGNDVEAVYAAASKAVNSSGLPQTLFFGMKTYRVAGTQRVIPASTAAGGRGFLE
jgi:TPP-dependent pyruvate/acetoin dehydrogenase alpha subunit